jgi:hypothetical protein
VQFGHHPEREEEHVQHLQYHFDCDVCGGAPEFATLHRVPLAAAAAPAAAPAGSLGERVDGAGEAGGLDECSPRRRLEEVASTHFTYSCVRRL